MKGTGDTAPGFTASGTTGEIELAAELRKGPVVLYFFPKANTSG